MKILIVNQPLGNRGDESAHKALVRRLMERVPFCNIEVLLINQDVEDIEIFRIPQVSYTNIVPGRFFYKFYIGTVRRGLPCLAAFHPQVRKLLAKFRQADAVICAPGGINLGGFRDWMHLATMSHVLRCNGNTAYFSRSIGPFGDDEFSILSKKILNSVKFLSLRDKKSYNLADSIGCKAFQTLDSAFLGKTVAAVPDEYKSSGYAVVVPNELIWHHDFKTLKRGEVCDFFRALIDRIHNDYPSLEIVLLPQLCGRQNDSLFMKEVSAGMEYVCVCSDDLDSDTQQSIIRNANFLIGCRYHSIVFAINNDTPFAALDYEHKISGMLEMLDLGGRAVRLGADNLDAGTIGKLMDIIGKPYSPSGDKASAIASSGFDELLKAIS